MQSEQQAGRQHLQLADGGTQDLDWVSAFSMQDNSMLLCNIPRVLSGRLLDVMMRSPWRKRAHDQATKTVTNARTGKRKQKPLNDDYI